MDEREKEGGGGVKALSAALAERIQKVGIKANKRGIIAQRCSFPLTRLALRSSVAQKREEYKLSEGDVIFYNILKTLIIELANKAKTSFHMDEEPGCLYS